MEEKEFGPVEVEECFENTVVEEAKVVIEILNVKWYGAPAPFFPAPDAVLEEYGMLVNGSVGRWDHNGHCSNIRGWMKSVRDRCISGLTVMCMSDRRPVSLSGMAAAMYPLRGVASGIVNRGCPDTTCPVSGQVDGLAERRANFMKVLQARGISHSDVDAVSFRRIPGLQAAWQFTIIMLDKKLFKFHKSLRSPFLKGSFALL